MNINFGDAYHVVNNYRDVKRYVAIAELGEFILGVPFEGSSKYTLLDLLNDLCEDSKEDGYTAIVIHRKDECFDICQREVDKVESEE